MFPRGIMDGLTFCFAILISVILINYLSYLYLEAQPSEAGASAVRDPWHGLLELSSPVDNIILGDSAANWNIITGPITDRLGGSVIDLGSNANSSVLTDGWMLDYYIKRWGAPKNVLLLRSHNGYNMSHNVEYLAAAPLDWGYWDNLVPTWKEGELIALFINKYIVIYSNSDVLSKRLFKPWTMFNQPYRVIRVSRTYSGGDPTEPIMDEILEDLSKSGYSEVFKPSSDSSNALEFICNLADKRGFNLYIIVNAECTEIFAYPERELAVCSTYDYLTQFTKFKNVYLIPDTPVLFNKDSMQGTFHLAPGAESVFTEKIIDAIVSIQNGKSKNDQLRLVSAEFDKTLYKAGEIPSLNVTIAGDGTDEIHGAVSCLIFKSGTTESEWVSRASAVNFDFGNNRIADLDLFVNRGKASDTGKYDVAIFIRVDYGSSCKEIKCILPNKLEFE